MAPRPDVSEERKQKILDTAEDVFVRNGIHQARIDDIAAGAGLSKGAIYWYFKKKDDIVAGLIERIFRRSLAGVRHIAEEDRPAVERLERIGRAVAKEFETMSKLLPIAYELYAMAIRQRATRRLIARFYAEYRSVIAPVIRQGMSEGAFSEGNADETAVLLIALYEGLGLLWAIDPSLVRWRDASETAMRLIFSGLRTRASAT